MNQEAHGGPLAESTYNSFHQYLPDFIMNQMCINGTMYHPTFLYESLWNILVLVLLLIIRRYNPLRGEVFLSYLLTYSDRKSTRLNSSHVAISYAVLFLKKKTGKSIATLPTASPGAKRTPIIRS